MATIFYYINSTYYTFCVFTLLFFSSSVLSVVRFTRLPLPSLGPESFAFNHNGEGPYTSISDGKIVKYTRGKVGFVNYGFTTPNRSKVLCDGTHDITLGMSCSRPLDLVYYYRTHEIYIADGNYKLFVVGSNRGLATQLATSADGVPFKFPDGIEVDQRIGVVYMTDASAVYGLNQIDLVVSQCDATGRLIKYDPTTKKVTVLIRGLSGGSGVAISKDGSFLIVSEFVHQRLQKYWLRGPKENTADILMKLIGSPWFNASLITEVNKN